jgi:hypothetical protein
MEHKNLGIDADGDATGGLKFCEGLGAGFPGPTRPWRVKIQTP